MKKAFDNAKYLKIQKEEILKRVQMFQNKLYLELGGKLFDDLHAARVLPGFEPDAKLQLLISLKDKVEIVMCINAGDIQKNKIRTDSGLSYGDEVLRLIDNFRDLNLYVSSVVITMFDGQSLAKDFATKLERHGEKVYFHNFTKGYPNDVETIVSEEGYGKNPYIQTTRPIVVVTAPGPNSGKLATCLSQLYHDNKKGLKSGYAKFETFPVWNLPLKHPVNVAYEAATADIKDVNMIDYYHYNAYNKVAVNYNRDIEIFPVLKNILKKITGEDVYKSPTDMGVNVVASAIIDDDVACLASKQEIVRRYYAYMVNYKRGVGDQDSIDRVKKLMNELEIDKSILPTIQFANNVRDKYNVPCVSIELPNGKIIVGKCKNILSAPGAALLNALKEITGVADKIDLIAKSVLDPVLELKRNVMKIKNGMLDVNDVLTILSICSVTNPVAKSCLDNIGELKGCNAHSVYILSMADELALKKLGLNLTCGPHFVNQNLSN